MSDSSKSTEPHIRVYSDRQEIYQGDTLLEKHSNSKRSEQAKARSRRIKSELDDSFLKSRLEQVAQHGLEDISNAALEREEFERLRNQLDAIVDGISPDRGRALAVHTVLLLTIKAIEPEQSIRLHKSSVWKEGLPMRGIDSEYISPEMSDRELVRVNRDGVMMTRTLAENLPYGEAYPANIRGPQAAWAGVIEILEATADGELADAALQYLLLALHNRGEDARELNRTALSKLDTLLDEGVPVSVPLKIITQHIERSPHAARLLEVALHSLYQPLDQQGALNGVLKPLTQMRSADRKHGNVADIEFVHPSDEFHIREALDGKHGHELMHRELTDLGPKLEQHPETDSVTFVTTREQSLSDEVREQQDMLAEQHGTTIEFATLKEIAQRALEAYHEAGLDPRYWLVSYVETLTHQRREVAPIDEPTVDWVEVLIDVLDAHTTQTTLEQG